MPSKLRSIHGPRKQAGFTLMELVITTVILAILTAAALPNFRDFMRRNNVTSQANNILVDFQNARSEAITRRKPVSICARAPGAAEDNTTCQLGSTNYDGGWVAYQTASIGNAFGNGAGFELVHLGSVSPSVSIRADAADATLITFNSRGELSDATQRILYACYKQATGQAAAGTSTAAVPGKQITISASGRAIIQDLASGAACG
jgi:type IV fimbrial biogenesis protein FimT